MVVSFYEGTKFLLRTLRVKLRISINSLDQLVVALDRHIAAEHIKDEPFINSLFHCVGVERHVFHDTVFVERSTKHLERLVLWGRCKRKVRSVGRHLA